jgi:hypothetical protein
MISIPRFLQFQSSRQNLCPLQCFWRSWHLLWIHLHHRVSYRRDCKGGEWWKKTCCSLSCNGQSMSNSART